MGQELLMHMEEVRTLVMAELEDMTMTTSLLTLKSLLMVMSKKTQSI